MSIPEIQFTCTRAITKLNYVISRLIKSSSKSFLCSCFAQGCTCRSCCVLLGFKGLFQSRRWVAGGMWKHRPWLQARFDSLSTNVNQRVEHSSVLTCVWHHQLIPIWLISHVRQYKDQNWVKDIRRWPPQLVQKLDQFLRRETAWDFLQRCYGN